MALITCTHCGHKISSQARFCPKCKYSENSVEDNSTSGTDSGAINTENVTSTIGVPPGSTNETAGNSELLQLQFKPSIDELVILEGRTFLIKSLLNVSDCYAYLTSKRYTLCDSSRLNIVFQIGINGLASVEESRHLIFKKIIITSVSGDTYQIKPHLHQTWLTALLNPDSSAYESGKQDPGLTAENATATEWYYMVDEIKTGPVKENNMIQFIRNNHTIYRNTNVWNAYLSGWKRAEETILSFYFRTPSTPGVVSGDMLETSGISSQSIYSRIGMLFKRYL